MAALLLGCGSPLGPSDGPAEPDQLSFRVGGSAFTYTATSQYLSSIIVNGALIIRADDYVGGGPSLVLTVSNYAGPGTYALGPGTAGREGQFRDGSVAYTTAAAGASGLVTVASESCRTTSGTDLATGIYATLTYCTLRGAFGCTLAADGGGLVAVTGGAFRVTPQRRNE